MKSQMEMLIATSLLFCAAGCGKSVDMGGLVTQAQETAAFANIAQVSSAQAIHRMEHEGVFANSIEELRELKPEIAAATNPGKAYQGYYFVVLPSTEREQFYAVAIPSQYGVSGKRTFLATADGCIYAKDVGAQAISAAPANPEGAGWNRVRGKARSIGPEDEKPPG